MAGHEESGRHAGVLRRDAGHRGDGDGDEDHADPESQYEQARQQVGGELGGA